MGNFVQTPTTYNRYYGDIKGVDFTSDHSQISEQRMAYSVNMYKDYQSGQGQAIETIPGFRMGFRNEANEGKVNGIHSIVIDGELHVLVHIGEVLYKWNNYPRTIGENRSIYIKLDAPIDTSSSLSTFVVTLPSEAESVAIIKPNGVPVWADDNNIVIDGKNVTIKSSSLYEGDIIRVNYTEASATVLRDWLHNGKSTSFIFNNRLYILDGENYWYYDKKGLSYWFMGYVPTVRINVVPGGENADVGKEYEQKNLLAYLFNITYVADGVTKEYPIHEQIGDIDSIYAYGTRILPDEFSYDPIKNSVTFNEAPKSPKEMGLPEGYAGLIITVYAGNYRIDGIEENTNDSYTIISGCTIAALFDNRVFLSGNPKYPNHIFWSGINDTGFSDPTYFGVLNYQQIGVENVPITGLVPLADSLMVLKGDTQHDGSVYFLHRQETGEDVLPVVYRATRGLHGIGCLGACANFLDDPVFVSRLGLEAVGQLSVRLERALEHRSSMVDAMLLREDLSHAELEEWNGYLLLLVDGKIFMADSRQRFTHPSGVIQYEWYYLDDIGVYDGQYEEFTYAEQMPQGFEGVKISHLGQEYEITIADNVFNEELYAFEDLRGKTANPPDETGKATCSICQYNMEMEQNGVTFEVPIYYVLKNEKAYLCETRENYIGGTFDKAITIKCIDGNIFFGTEKGKVCAFNFDKREADGSILPTNYSFNGRAIFCGFATKMDCCGTPHLTKNTVKKSTVIKTKNFVQSGFKLKVRTNKVQYKEIASAGSGIFNFGSADFADFTFSTSEQSIFVVKEKEKKWVEKQYFIFSDEYLKPFGVYHISFGYTIAGKYKG